MNRLKLRFSKQPLIRRLLHNTQPPDLNPVYGFGNIMIYLAIQIKKFEGVDIVS